MESSQYARESIRVMVAATELVGGAAEAEAWFRNRRIADFNSKTAEDLVAEGRVADVLRYLEMLSAGPSG
jgi:hypothetical protein